MAQAKQSVKRLAELDFDVLCTGHGSVVRYDAKTRVQRLAARL